jgi:hypothetical protein
VLYDAVRGVLVNDLSRIRYFHQGPSGAEDGHVRLCVAEML